MISVREALARILAAVPLIPAEHVALADAHGRALAEDIVASRPQPPGDVSAMDGYAVRAADVARVPTELRLIGESAAGRAFPGRVGPGDAVRTFTGALVPEGADTIIIQEHTNQNGARVVIHKGAPPGKHIRRKGYDFAAGACVLKAGTLLDARALALSAAANRATITVRRAPQVALLATGDELRPPGTPLGQGEIAASNTIALAGLVRRAGGQPIDLGIAADSVEAVASAAEAGRAADFLVITGGMSVGTYDVVQESLRGRGLEVDFWRIAMRPGKPVMFGLWEKRPVFGLPGNPVSAIVTALLFLRAALRKAQGLDPTLPVEMIPVGCTLPAGDEREDYLRARLEADDQGRVCVVPLPVQDSAMLTGLAAADALLVRPVCAPALPEGGLAPVVRLAGLL
jgi:molybdopterin molybdotransferase